MADGCDRSASLGDALDGVPFSALQVRVVMLCSLVVFLDGYDIQTMGLAVPTLSSHWGLAPSSFSLALAASVIGLGVGSIVLAPLGDRFGRRPLIIGSLFLLGISSLLTSMADGLAQLVLLRFVTGIMLGSCQGNAAVLVAEYASARRRTGLMTLVGCNVAAGSLFAAWTAPWVIATLGWRGLFHIGGILPIAIAMFLALSLPESVAWLQTRKPEDARIKSIMRRLFKDRIPDIISPPKAGGRGIWEVLQPAYRQRTLLLWGLYSLNTLLLFLLLSWLPTLLATAGWPQHAALRAIALVQGGGIAGGLALSALADRGYLRRALLIAYGGTVVVTLGFAALMGGSAWLFLPLLFLLGAGVFGAPFIVLAIIANVYPPDIRATGYGWAGAVSRIGAGLGPLIGGAVLALGVEPRAIIALLALPALGCVLLVGPVLRLCLKTGPQSGSRRG